MEIRSVYQILFLSLLLTTSLFVSTTGVIADHDTREPDEFDEDEEVIYSWLESDFVQQYELEYIPEKYFVGADIPKTSDEVEDARINMPYWIVSYNRIYPVNATPWNEQNIQEYTDYTRGDDGGALHEMRAYNKSNGEQEHISIHSVERATTVFKYNNTTGGEQRYEDETVRYISNNGTVRGVYMYRVNQSATEEYEPYAEKRIKRELELEKVETSHHLKVYTQDEDSGTYCTEQVGGCYVTDEGPYDPTTGELPPAGRESDNETHTNSPNTHGVIELEYNNLSNYVRWIGNAEFEIVGGYTPYYTVKKWEQTRNCEEDPVTGGIEDCPSWSDFDDSPDETKETVPGNEIDVEEIDEDNITIDNKTSDRYEFVRPDNFGTVHPEDEEQYLTDSNCGTNFNTQFSEVYDETNPLERLYTFDCRPAMSVVRYPGGSAEIIFRGNFRTRDDNWAHPIPSVKVGDRRIHTGWNYFTSRNKSWDDLYESGSKEDSYPSKVRPIETRAVPVERDFGSTGYYAVDFTYLFNQPVTKNVPRLFRHSSCIQHYDDDAENTDKILCTLLLSNNGFDKIENMNEAEELWNEKRKNNSNNFTPGSVQYGEYENDKHPYNKRYQPVESVYISAPEYGGAETLQIEGFVNGQNITVTGDEYVEYEVTETNTQIQYFEKYDINSDEGSSRIRGQVISGDGIEEPDEAGKIDYWNNSDRKWAPIKITIRNESGEVIDNRPSDDYVVVRDSVPVTNDNDEVVGWEDRKIDISESENEDGFVYAIVSRDVSNVEVTYNSSHWTDIDSGNPFSQSNNQNFEGEDDWENRLHTGSVDRRINPSSFTFRDIMQIIIVLLLTAGFAFAATKYIIENMFNAGIGLSTSDAAKQSYNKTAGTLTGSFRDTIYGLWAWLPGWIKILIIFGIIAMLTGNIFILITSIIESVGNAL